MIIAIEFLGPALGIGKIIDYIKIYFIYWQFCVRKITNNSEELAVGLHQNIYY